MGIAIEAADRVALKASDDLHAPTPEEKWSDYLPSPTPRNPFPQISRLV
jgi:hypothetical protein